MIYLGCTQMAVVAEIARKSVVTVSPDATLRDAAKLMKEARIGSLLVVSETGRLLGIITERDIVRAIAEGADPDKALVKDYMTLEPITARSEDSVVSVAHKMIHHGIRHLPVVDEASKLIGVVSIRDVLRHIVGEHEFP